MSIATKRGDKGTTGLLYGGRVRKDSARIECNGAVDEAQAALGFARALVASEKASGPGGFSTAEVDELLVAVERDLWVLMAEVATPPSKRNRLSEGVSLVSPAMLARLDGGVEALEAAEVMPSEFVVPGENPASAALDLARTVVRRAERRAVRLESAEGSLVVPYLNRLSDLCWLLARALEGSHVAARTGPRPRRRPRTPEQQSPTRQQKRNPS
ncbi:MAG TPA: cob(I)yrinic acid a,c-diamide adenosyltransferase [Acidimicrobiales bacterium]|nr:cob(I)yrinic acid a,c-diamide adenosyltransferase [Acidimicrobiales bacterium]